MLVNSARWLVLIAAAVPLAYYAAAIACALALFGRRNQKISDFCPPVSVLKPIHGLDRETYHNLASFCRQQYPNYELLLCVGEVEDPAIPIIERLIAEFPQLSVRLLIGTPTAGSNNKVAKLCRLAAEASQELLVASDADIRVEPDYLRRVVAPFRHERVGAVTCLYRGITEPSLWSELQDVAITSNFIAGVLVAWKLGLRFALGATMAVRRQALAEIGGFEALANLAADDHELGKRIAARGYRVEIAQTVAETECVARNFPGFFRYHLRRAVVTRESQSLGHLGFLFAQGLPWTIVAMALLRSRMAAGFVAAYLALRLGVAFTVGGWGLRDPLIRRKWWLVLFDDVLGFVVWLVSLVASRVVWQGSAYNVRHGYLVPTSTIKPGSSV